MDVNMATPVSETPAPETPAPETPAPETPRPDAQSSEPGVADPAVRRLVTVVDDLSDLGSLPVEAHAARYREVHDVLQDALSDTARGGPQPS